MNENQTENVNTNETNVENTGENVANEGAGNVQAGKTIMTSDDNTTENPADKVDNAGNTDNVVDKKEEDWTVEKFDGFEEERLKSFIAGCKSIGLSKEQSLKFLEMKKQEMDKFERTQLDWQKSIINDKEFGGANYSKSIADAKRALIAYDTDGHVRKMLDETGYGNHPEIIKVFARAGANLREDNILKAKAQSAEKPLSERFFANKSK